MARWNLTRLAVRALPLLAVVGATACYLGTAMDGAHDAGGPRPDGRIDLPDAWLGLTGLPCAVAHAVTPCTGCHSPGGSAPMSLLSYADLTRLSPSDPSRTVAQLAVARMLDPLRPMPPPPAPRAGDADVAALEAWIAAGYPPGTCETTADGGVDGAGSDYATPLTCTSGVYTLKPGNAGTSMYPGRACIACHRQETEAPRFTLAGTVYPSAHEYDDCNGAAGLGVTVLVTDATLQQISLVPDPIGNFATEAVITPPFAAKMVAGGRERAMSQHQTSGDCNSCHTESGANGAPGRIMLP